MTWDHPQRGRKVGGLPCVLLGGGAGPTWQTCIREPSSRVAEVLGVGVSPSETHQSAETRPYFCECSRWQVRNEVAGEGGPDRSSLHPASYFSAAQVDVPEPTCDSSRGGCSQPQSWLCSPHSRLCPGPTPVGTPHSLSSVTGLTGHLHDLPPQTPCENSCLGSRTCRLCVPHAPLSLCGGSPFPPQCPGRSSCPSCCCSWNCLPSPPRAFRAFTRLCSHHIPSSEAVWAPPTPGPRTLAPSASAQQPARLASVEPHCAGFCARLLPPSTRLRCGRRWNFLPPHG